MKRFLALLAVAAMIAAAILLRRTLFGSSAGASGTITVPVICAEEIADYCRSSVDRFQATNPKVGGRAVRVDLTTRDSADAEAAIASQKEKPLVWIPTSSAWIDRANAEYRSRFNTDLFLKSGEYQVLPIAESPTVFLGPKERLDVLARYCGGSLTWPCIRDAVTKTGGWGAIGGNPNWGLVKFGYANPVAVNEGLQALILMSYGYYDKVTDLSPGDITNVAFVQFIRDIGTSVTSFADSAADYERDLATSCPGAYDVAMAYEFVAATDIGRPRAKACGLFVAYPSINVKSDFPFSIAVTPASTAVEKDAALKLRNFFYSPDNQKAALTYGLRPTNPDVDIAGSNPLTDNQGDKGGVQLQLPRADIADFPSFDTVQALLQTWEQKVERK